MRTARTSSASGRVVFTGRLTRQLEELDEEHSGDDGLLAEARNDKGKVTAKGVKDRLRDIRDDKSATDERKALNAYAALLDKESVASKKVKDTAKKLDAAVAAKYPKLAEADVKALVVEDKWIAALAEAVRGELDRVSQVLTTRVRQLAERYAKPLPVLDAEVETLAARVDGHLRAMGFGHA